MPSKHHQQISGEKHIEKYAKRGPNMEPNSYPKQEKGRQRGGKGESKGSQRATTLYKSQVSARIVKNMLAHTFPLTNLGGNLHEKSIQKSSKIQSPQNMEIDASGVKSMPTLIKINSNAGHEKYCGDNFQTYVFLMCKSM